MELTAGADYVVFPSEGKNGGLHVVYRTPKDAPMEVLITPPKLDITYLSATVRGLGSVGVRCCCTDGAVVSFGWVVGPELCAGGDVQ